MQNSVAGDDADDDDVDDDDDDGEDDENAADVRSGSSRYVLPAPSTAARPEGSLRRSSTVSIRCRKHTPRK